MSNDNPMPTETPDEEDTTPTVSPPPQTRESASPGQMFAVTTPIPEVVPSAIETGGESPHETSATPHPIPSIASPSPHPEGCLFEYDSTFPDFITPSVIKQLNSVEGGPRWVEMVRMYLRLESQYRLRVSWRRSSSLAFGLMNVNGA